MKSTFCIVVLVVFGFASAAYSQPPKAYIDPVEAESSSEKLNKFAQTRFDCPGAAYIKLIVRSESGEWSTPSDMVVFADDNAVIHDAKLASGQLNCWYTMPEYKYSKVSGKSINFLIEFYMQREAPPHTTCEAHVESVGMVKEAYFICTPE